MSQKIIEGTENKIDLTINLLILLTRIQTKFISVFFVHHQTVSLLSYIIMILQKRIKRKSIELNSQSLKPYLKIERYKSRKSLEQSRQNNLNPEKQEKCADKLVPKKYENILQQKTKKTIYSETFKKQEDLNKNQQVSERIIVQKEDKIKAKQKLSLQKIVHNEQEIEGQLILKSINTLDLKNIRIIRKPIKTNQRYGQQKKQPEASFFKQKKQQVQEKRYNLDTTIRLASNEKQIPNLYKKSTSSLNKSRRIVLQRYQTEPQQESVSRSGQKMNQILNVVSIQPKKQNNIRRSRKNTAMNRYDFQFENIRLAQKLIKIKPSRVCDVRQQKKFFQKHQYFKYIRSCSIDMDKVNSCEKLKLLSQSVALPKIYQKYHTIDM